MKSTKNIYMYGFIPWIVEVLFCVLIILLKNISLPNKTLSIFIFLIWLQFIFTLLLVGIAETTSSEADHPRYSIRLAMYRWWIWYLRRPWKDFKYRLWKCCFRQKPVV